MKKEEDPTTGNGTLKGRAWFGASRKPRGGWGSMNKGQRSRQGPEHAGPEKPGRKQDFSTQSNAECRARI